MRHGVRWGPVSSTPGRVDDPFANGARLFDSGEFFEAHEAWEQRWKVVTDATERRFFQGLIQVAAAFHKLLVMRSPVPAQRLLARGIDKLEACPRLVAEHELRTFCEQLRGWSRDLAVGRFVREVPKMGHR
jgi:predicted metal-dependent hydrolase